MKRLFTFFIITFLFIQLQGQVTLSPTVIASAGDYAEAGGISLSWTLGEVAVTTLEQGDIVLTQGFQQSYQRGVGIDLNPVDWQISAYPNPVDNQLTVRFDVREPTDFWIEIQDVTGRMVSQKEYNEVHPGDLVRVNMGEYRSGIYLFRIFTPDRQQMRVISVSKL